MERDSSLVFHSARHVVLCWFNIVPWRLICVSLHYSWIRVIKCDLKMLTFNFFCIFQRKGFWGISFWFMRSLWNLRRLSRTDPLESIVTCSSPHIFSCWRFNVTFDVWMQALSGLPFAFLEPIDYYGRFIVIVFLNIFTA